jgi:uncharacterized membrane protein
MRKKVYLFLLFLGIVLFVMGFWNMPKPDISVFVGMLRITFLIITSPFVYGIIGIVLLAASSDALQREKRLQRIKRARLARPAIQQEQKARGKNKLTKVRHDNIWKIIRYDLEHNKTIPEIRYSLKVNHKIDISSDTLTRIIKERT